MHTRRIAVLATAALTVASAACHKAPPAPTPTPALQSKGPDADSLRRAQADEAARRAAADEAARRKAADDAAAAAARAAADAAASARTTLLAMVHFEYDQSDLRADDKALLDAKVP